MNDKEGRLDADYHHLTLLASNDQGYKNLMKLATLGHTQGFYYKPRIDLNALNQYSAGLIALSGCLRGEIAKTILNKSEQEIQKVLAKYLAIFGPDNFYLEIQRNSKIKDPK